MCVWLTCCIKQVWCTFMNVKTRKHHCLCDKGLSRLGIGSQHKGVHWQRRSPADHLKAEFHGVFEDTPDTLQAL